MCENVFADLPSLDVWEQIERETRPLVIYGMGNGADKLLARLSALGKEPAAFFASDDFVRGQFFHGFPVLRFSEVREKYSEFLILVSFATRQADVMERLFCMAEEYPLLMPDMAVAGDFDFTRAFFEEHRTQIQKTYDLLQDNLSKTLFVSSVFYKYTGDIRYLKNAFSEKDDPIAMLADREIHTAIDGGAYVGDTATSLLAAHPEVVELLAIEPDLRNHRRLSACVEKEGLSSRVTPIQGALWSTEGSAVFSESGNRNSSLHSTSYEHKDSLVSLLTVDALTSEKTVDYIKYDVEGAEGEALLGSRETILRDHPALAVSLYHRPEDLFALPLWIHQLSPSYRFYLRRPMCLPAWELTLYAL